MARTARTSSTGAWWLASIITSCLAITSLFVVTSAPVAAVPPAAGQIGSITFEVVHAADYLQHDAELDTTDPSQLFLVEPENVVEVQLTLVESGEDADLSDSFRLELLGGAFSGTYTATTSDGNSDGGACTTTWEATGVASGSLEGDVVCEGVGVNHTTELPLALTMPAEGPMVLQIFKDTELEDAPPDYQVHFFVAEDGDTIYVGSGGVADGAADCAEGGRDFTTDDAGQGSIDQALYAAFLAVDDDDDVIEICDGEYAYGNDFRPFDGTVFHDRISLEAESIRGVTLDGGASFDLDHIVEGDLEGDLVGFQLLNVTGVHLSVHGIVFSGGEHLDTGEDESSETLYGGGAIRSTGGVLYLEDCSLIGNAAYVGGGILVGGGMLTMERVLATGNLALGGGAVSAINIEAVVNSTTIVDSTFEENLALEVGGGVLQIYGDLDVTATDFVGNRTGFEGFGIGGGAIGMLATEFHIRGGTFDSNRCSDEDDVLLVDCSGGAIFHDTDFDESLGLGPSTVTGVTFTNNAADSGGAIFANETYYGLAITSSSFLTNRALDQGGAIRISSGHRDTMIRGNRFVANDAAQGGAVSINDGIGEDPQAYLWEISGNAFTGNHATDSGGALHMALDNSGNVVPPKVRSNRLSRNSASLGGAVVVESNFGTMRSIMQRYQRALRFNRFISNRSLVRSTQNIGVHFDE